MRRHIFALTFVAVPLAAALVGAQSSRGTETKADNKGIEVDALDRKADPCVDFYQFACGGWVAKHPVPADRRSYGRFTEVQDRNFTILRRILETPDADPASDRHKAADYYSACMDEAKTEAAGLTPLRPDLTTIDELVNPDDLPVLVAHLHLIGVRALFRFGSQTDVGGDATQQIAVLDQGGLSLPDRDYYVRSDERSADLRAKFAAAVARMLALAGTDAAQADADAKTVLAVETALAGAQLDRVARRDPKQTQHTVTLNALQAMTPNFSWRKYAQAAEAPKFQVLNVQSPEYVKAVDRLIASTPLPDIKAYLRWHVIHDQAEHLPAAIADADFDFFSRTLAGQKEQPPRWRRCVSETDQQLGEALGKAFVDEAFSPQAKADALRMVQDIRAAMQQDID